MDFAKRMQLTDSDQMSKIDEKTNRVSASVKALTEDPFENIEKISDSLNFKKLDVYIVNKDLSSPYKIDSELVEIEILGTLGKWITTN